MRKRSRSHWRASRAASADWPTATSSTRPEKSVRTASATSVAWSGDLPTCCCTPARGWWAGSVRRRPRALSWPWQRIRPCRCRSWAGELSRNSSLADFVSEANSGDACIKASSSQPRARRTTARTAKRTWSTLPFSIVPTAATSGAPTRRACMSSSRKLLLDGRGQTAGRKRPRGRAVLEPRVGPEVRKHLEHVGLAVAEEPLAQAESCRDPEERFARYWLSARSKRPRTCRGKRTTPAQRGVHAFHRRRPRSSPSRRWPVARSAGPVAGVRGSSGGSLSSLRAHGAWLIAGVQWRLVGNGRPRGQPFRVNSWSRHRDDVGLAATQLRLQLTRQRAF